MILVSPTEPAAIKQIGRVSPVPERMGCDLIVRSGRRQVGVQRKQFPHDFIASMRDNRLVEQLHKMQELELRMLLVEGFGHWTQEGELIQEGVLPTRLRYSKGALLGSLMTFQFEMGIPVHVTRNMGETVEYLLRLDSWVQKKKHTSHLARPGVPKSSWGTVGNRDYGIYLLQSFPGVGVELAGRIYDHFGGVPLMWTATIKQLQEVPGIGKGKAEKIVKVLSERVKKVSGSSPEGNQPDPEAA